jgi:hypothetical protein
MFVSYEVVDWFNTEVKEKDIRVIITDSDFVEEISIHYTPKQGLNVMSPLIKLYESKGLNVAANVAMCYVYLCKRFGLKPQEFLTNIIAVNEDVARYKDNIVKYIALM